MTTTAHRKQGPAWSYSAGEWGKTRVRVYDRGSRGMYAEFWEDTSTGRKKVRLALGTTDREVAKQKADALALAFRTQVREKHQDLTLRTLFDMYEREVTHTKCESTQAHDRRAAEMFCRFFGATRLVRTLNAVDWGRFITERRRGAIGPKHGRKGKQRPVRNRVIEYDLRFLVAVLNFATVAGDGRGCPLLDRNPLKGLPFPREDAPRRPMLTEEQYQTLLTIAPGIHPLFELAVILAHETGHRASSIRQVRWSDIDLDRRRIRWRAEHDKVGFEHVTPLTDVALRALAARQKAVCTIGDAWVFPSVRTPTEPCSRQTLLGWWKRGARQAGLTGLERLGYHSLRRNFASEMKHTPLRDLSYLGGWKSPQTLLAVYQQPDEATQRDALANRKAIRSAHG